MNCDRCTELFADFLDERLDAPSRKELEEHLGSCPRCEEELRSLSRLWPSLEAAHEWAVASTATPSLPRKRRFELLLGAFQHGRSEAAASRRRWIAALVAVAILVALGEFAVLRAAWRDAAAGPTVATGPSREFLLALYQPPRDVVPSLEEQKTAAEEYGAWARELEGKGHLVAAGRLRVQGHLLDLHDGEIDMQDLLVHLRDEYLSGFFLLRAADEEEALRIAATCPHLRGGGTIELRELGFDGNVR